MSSPGSVREVRLPPAVVRAMLRYTLRPVLSERVPVRWQRRLVDAAAVVLPRAADARVHRTVLGAVPVTCVRSAAAEPGYAVLYLHGGGFTTGSPRAFRSLAAALSRATGAVVYLADYRLAPEHPYPAALTDALAAYRGLLAAGIPAGRVVLAGDSAGAHLALSAALRLRDEHGPLPAGLVLISPWLDLALTGRSIGDVAGRDPELTAGWLRACDRAYRAGAAPGTPGLAPLTADLAGLPPLHVQAGAAELLVSDADRLVERARAGGVPVRYDRWPGMWHDFQVFAGRLAAADRAVEVLGRSVRGWWADGSVGGSAVGGSAVGGSAPAGELTPTGDLAPTAPAADALPPMPRAGEPELRREPSVVIVGAGFGGLGMAIELAKRGHRNFVIVDKAARIGGVWRDNTYPGAACDIPSLQYCYSFEPRDDWPRRYSGQADIVAYLERCVDRYRLGEHLRLGTEVLAADFADGTGRWTLQVRDGQPIEADVVVFACGQLSRPSYPDIPGLDRFAGTTFHSARWDHGHDLTGRRVAVVGTGSSALQFVPAIAPVVGRLTVFQRTAGWIVPKLDRRYTDRQHARQRRRPQTMAAARHRWDLLEEAVTFGITGHSAALAPGRLLGRTLLRLQVRDPELRRKLTPGIEFGCKRVGFSSDYYPTFNRSTVDLVTTPIAELTETGIRTVDGAVHDVDTIILGTGFATTEFLAPIRVRGAGGQDLAEPWRDGARAYLGITVPGFPNMFLMYGPNTNLGSGSIVHMLECQARYIGSAVDLIAAGPARLLAVRSDVEEAYDQWIQRRLRRTAWVGCQNWYRTAAGRVTNNWPGHLREYRRLTDRVELVDYRLPASTDERRLAPSG